MRTTCGWSPDGRTSLVVANSRAVGNRESGVFVDFFAAKWIEGVLVCCWQIDHYGKQHRCTAVKIPNVQSIDTELVIAKISRSLCQTPRKSDPGWPVVGAGSGPRRRGIIAKGANPRSTKHFGGPCPLWGPSGSRRRRIYRRCPRPRYRRPRAHGGGWGPACEGSAPARRGGGDLPWRRTTFAALVTTGLQDRIRGYRQQ
jgi:hypothetical protein